MMLSSAALWMRHEIMLYSPKYHNTSLSSGRRLTPYTLFNDSWVYNGNNMIQVWYIHEVFVGVSHNKII